MGNRAAVIRVLENDTIEVAVITKGGGPDRFEKMVRSIRDADAVEMLWNRFWEENCVHQVESAAEADAICESVDWAYWAHPSHERMWMFRRAGGEYWLPLIVEYIENWEDFPDDDWDEFLEQRCVTSDALELLLPNAPQTSGPPLEPTAPPADNNRLHTIRMAVLEVQNMRLLPAERQNVSDWACAALKLVGALPLEMRENPFTVVSKELERYSQRQWLSAHHSGRKDVDTAFQTTLVHGMDLRITRESATGQWAAWLWVSGALLCLANGHEDHIQALRAGLDTLSERGVHISPHNKLGMPVYKKRGGEGCPT